MFELNDENKRPIAAIAAVLVIALAAWFIYLNLHSSRTESQPKLLVEGLDEALAQAVIQAVGDHGQFVLVTYSVHKSGGLEPGDRREFDNYAALVKTQEAGFQQALRSHPGVVIAGTERVELGISPQDEAAKGMSAHSSYFALAKKYPNADVIVSLIDAPNLDPEDLHRLPTRLPKIITMSNFSGVPNLRRLSEAGLLHAAILPRWSSVTDAAKPRTPAEWFVRSYQIVTPANIDALLNPPSVN